jgi:hypothetical protein
MFVKAIYYREEKTVHYFDEQGNETLYIGGSFAWRTNNPGNIGKPGKRSVTTYIGMAQRTSKSKALFLIFPDKKTGDMERARVLKEAYGDSSIRNMMDYYAPVSDGNDPAAYTAMITKQTGIPGSAIVGKLKAAQFDALMAAMEKKEGYIPGQIKELGKPLQVTLKDKLKQPMADQNIQIKGASKTVDVKTDEHGAMPPVYSKLLGGEAELLHVQSSCTSEKIGKVSCDSTAKGTTFSAPYFLSKSTPNVHKTEEKTQPKVHIVKARETLSTIASQYDGVTVESLVKENGLKDANKIWERQHLRIPGKGGSSTSWNAAPAQESSPTVAAPAPASTSAKSSASTPPQSAGPEMPTTTPSPDHGPQTAPGPKRQKDSPPSATKPEAKTTAHNEKKATPSKPTPKSAVTVDQQRSDKNHPVTVLSSPTLEPSGKKWNSRFMGSKNLDDLNSDFQPKAKAFYSAMKAAGISVNISVTFRPIERSYLMYYAFKIAKGGSPVNVETWPGVNIDWAHRDADGKPDLVAAKQAAIDMCKEYGLKLNSKKQLVGKPSLSRHNAAAAVDMNIGNYVGKTIKDNTGAKIKIENFDDLVDVGESYGVKYFPKENMHWSDTGH